MNAWIPKKLTFGQEIVNGAATREFHFTVTAQGAKRFLIIINASAVVGPIHFVTTTAVGGLPQAITHGTTNVNSSGQTIIEVLPTSGQPILSQATVTMTVDTGKSITLDSIHVLQEE
jgi:hypothetical protein